MQKVLTMIIYLTFITSCWSGSDETIIVQKKRDNITHVKSSIQQFSPNEVYSSWAYISVLGNYTSIIDSHSYDHIINLYDKDVNLKGKAGEIGVGPGEISTLGGVVYDENRNMIYVLDLGGKRTFSFCLDSIIKNPSYKPIIKHRLNGSMFPTYFVYINDTLSYGTIAQYVGPNTVREKAGKWNMKTGAIEVHNCDFENQNSWRVVSSYSKEYKVLVECSRSYDQINIFDKDLNLMHRIHGPNWHEKVDYIYHFNWVLFYKNYILASYDGTKFEENNRPTIVHVFDLEGNYIKTLDIGYKIWRMSTDEENARLYFTFDDVIQFGYLDLKGILD